MILHKTEGITALEVCRLLQNRVFYYCGQWKLCPLEILERDHYTCQTCGRFIKELVAKGSYLNVHLCTG